MRIACHVDDILARGNREESTKFWNVVDAKFGLKEWHICEYDNPPVVTIFRLRRVAELQWYRAWPLPEVQCPWHLASFLVP